MQDHDATRAPADMSARTTDPDRTDASGEPVLVAGGPRMGTTWVAQVLGQAEGVTWINEPDNEWPNPFALKAKLSLGRFPVLGEDDPAPRAYRQLWERSLAGFRHGRYQEALAWKLDRGERTMLELWRAMCDHANPRMSATLRLLTIAARPPHRRDSPGQDRPGRVMVKSVHAPLALEWVSARLRPRILVVLRNPLNVIASWTDLGWGGCALETNPAIRTRVADRWGLPLLGGGASPLARAAWEVGLFTCALHAGLERHPDWLSASHESLCTDPVGGFRTLYAALGLAWSERAEAFLDDSNRPGEGFSTLRVASLQPGRWRDRLSPDQLREIWSVLSPIRAPWVARLADEAM